MNRKDELERRPGGKPVPRPLDGGGNGPPPPPPPSPPPPTPPEPDF